MTNPCDETSFQGPAIEVDEQGREFEFVNITCPKIARVQVVGGDHCELGDLSKYSAKKGECLARVRVVASELVRFDK